MARRGGMLPGKTMVALAAVLGISAGTGTLGTLVALAIPDGHAPHGARIIQGRAGGTAVSHGWTPWMTQVVTQVRARWPQVSCGGQADGSETGHIPGSDHYTGNAADCTAGRYGVRATGRDRATNDAVAAWVLGNAGRLHVKYVIWYARIDNLDGHGWQPYCDQLDPSCSGVTYEHYDHVHISVVH